MPPSSEPKGYDVIGDVHGCAAELHELLHLLGYRVDESSGAYAHPERQAIFVGDLVDRGPGQLDVLQTVRRMTDHGSARVVMGNHEFNAIAYATANPDEPGEFLRRHSGKNTNQHRAFLDQLDDDSRADYLDWFLSMPMWLDLGPIRVVHACWHEPSMRVVKDALGSERFTTRDQLVRASTKGDPLYDAVEVLLKGPELDLAAYGQPPYYDKDGAVRGKARVAWWRDGASTLHELSVMDSNFMTADGEPYPPLPDIEVPARDRSFAYAGDVPVFYGHYWRRGRPQRGADFTDHTACVDFSAIKTGALVAYRWSGETTIREQHYVNVKA
ncbi:metallophosphatase [Mycolicibacterium madagascariense]|uniref:Metallophosphatase n=1 Tax=Mycolicibacterium madagascariense TaxID=212765 RepID=A0A7I7XDG4_9MYCO|nr:metallophosphoesterase [Mycolicibacterium madagascariense]MCV7011311.1 metallophosphoesterase [Mycolicibacterium madagascariense]BBZ26691.1 metallophosphatase [Mycolicibacterium madagascariense]